MTCVVWLEDDKHMNIPYQHTGKEENSRMSYKCKFLPLKMCKCKRGFNFKALSCMAVCNVKTL